MTDITEYANPLLKAFSDANNLGIVFGELRNYGAELR